jgi:hypothetical protein
MPDIMHILTHSNGIKEAQRDVEGLLSGMLGDAFVQHFLKMQEGTPETRPIRYDNWHNKVPGSFFGDQPQVEEQLTGLADRLFKEEKRFHVEVGVSAF